MQLKQLVSFRKDLLFQGAVQLDWLEHNPDLAQKAAQHFAFHGPRYHGIVREGAPADGVPIVDTATFTRDVIERITGRRVDEPFSLAIAGYGTGKSHLALTLAELLRAPQSPLAERVLANLYAADESIGRYVQELLAEVQQPFLVVALNGMKDFDLTAEIVRQVRLALAQRDVDTTALDDLRPRFRHAVNFTESFYASLSSDYSEAFGSASVDEIIAHLKAQDESAFQRVDAIYERKMGASIRQVGQESLQDAVRVVQQAYCGPGKPFAGVLILLDEFGRYLEFAVQRPHVAGPGALQQLHEAVQANAERVFLLCFIQNELKAYVARAAMAQRDDVQRYVTRYDSVQRKRLSTNIETLIANLLDKANAENLAPYLAKQPGRAETLHAQIRRWWPEADRHALWTDRSAFLRVVVDGCWPLHPLATWLLCRLASVGRLLQQRSALSLLADSIDALADAEVTPGFAITAVDLCSQALVDEFVASERWGQMGAAAQTYRSVCHKYEGHLTAGEIRALKAVLLLAKTGVRLQTRDEGLEAIAALCGEDVPTVSVALHSLEAERGAVIWNEGLKRYEIISDAVPRADFVRYLQGKVGEITAAQRAQIFASKFGRWFEDLGTIGTDFGSDRDIRTKEWRYTASFATVEMLANQINFAFRTWLDARAVDAAKGQLIYCYLEPESDRDRVREAARGRLRECLDRVGLDWGCGAPLVVVLLHDTDGLLGDKIAELAVLQDMTKEQEAERFGAFMDDRRNSTTQEARDIFDRLCAKADLVLASGQSVPYTELRQALEGSFRAIYAKAIPFPFDGLSTPTGNGARECAEITRTMVLGHVDADWISAQPDRLKRRAFAVLRESWEALDDAGSLRHLPAEANVRAVMDEIEKQLESDDDSGGSVCLGLLFRKLCLPPYGCNLASAGLLLALFIGARKTRLQILLGGQSHDASRWLERAMPGNYFDLTVLEDTRVIRVRPDDEDTWRLLLNEWEIEKTHEGKIVCEQRACDLSKRMRVPPAFHHRYELLRQQAQKARAELRAYEDAIESGLKRIEAAVLNGDVAQLSWGAAELAAKRLEMESQKECWTSAQLCMLAKPEAEARIRIGKLFPAWLSRQRPIGLAQTGEFIRRMKRVEENLAVLGLKEEKDALASRLADIEDHVRFVNDVHNMRETATEWARARMPAADTRVAELENVLKQVTEWEDKINQARARKVEVVRADLDATASVLKPLKDACQRLLKSHRARILRVYNAEIRSLDDVRILRQELDELMRLFAGDASNVDDLALARRQLLRMEEDWQRMENHNLDDSEFEALVAECLKTAPAELGSDELPLDLEAAYAGMAASIREARKKAADAWMLVAVPERAVLAQAEAQVAIETIKRLRAAPRYLSPQQMYQVGEMLEACDRRLEELEVDGLVARYQALSETNQRAFLERIGMVWKT
ncbi:MAG: hypothetical protein ACUVX9_03340 [Anaerolineae bacterium]